MLGKLARLSILSIVISVLFVTQVSCLGDGTRPLPELRLTLIRLADEYIASLANCNYAKLNSMLLWSSYLQNNDSFRSKGDYLGAVRALCRDRDLRSKTFANLELLDVQVKESSAQLRFAKPGSRSSEHLRLTFFWTGSAWRITDDSIF